MRRMRRRGGHPDGQFADHRLAKALNSRGDLLRSLGRRPDHGIVDQAAAPVRDIWPLKGAFAKHNRWRPIKNRRMEYRMKRQSARDRCHGPIGVSACFRAHLNERITSGVGRACGYFWCRGRSLSRGHCAAWHSLVRPSDNRMASPSAHDIPQGSYHRRFSGDA